jgi:L-asparaginase/Glu-tRNA(Gln) amidotransferase subunit D
LSFFQQLTEKPWIAAQAGAADHAIQHAACPPRPAPRRPAAVAPETAEHLVDRFGSAYHPHMPKPSHPPRLRVALICTGGTIEKTYDELEGILSNRVSVLEVMLSQLQLSGVETVRIALMNKDSLDMSAEDHDLIARS